MQANLTRRTLLHLILLALGLVMVYPVIWMLLSSFKSDSHIFSSSALLPEVWSTANYTKGWSGVPKISFGTFFANSFFVAGAVVVGNVVSASLTAFAFGRMQFKLKQLWFSVMIVTMMLPAQIILIPQYLLFNKLGWVNTYLPLIVPHFFGAAPFFIFLMVQFIRGLPKELDESARMDGCGVFQIFLRIVMPLCVPAIITTAIFSFIWTWDDFFTQLVYINDPVKFTVPLGLRLFLDGGGTSQWGAMFAMSVLSLIPSFMVFLLAQKYFVQGIATTGMKN
ncbi:carbohydrate ABC transporter permease [Paenibacillus thalictri]|uniref:Carbohydrate ABC transporter permease n=1 Tax=Paenibacillus thalictri TaxID=2527873 RepID=A0A4Q9DJM8_9BACL|nr:carbohydrate ABC transporter permease [Paenibacillus thalictri]TBL73241.1 carbohydrate ABC transporter permease [Paenibacillus thalictri]